MKTKTAIERERLAALLEDYGSSLQSFDRLGTDAYEPALAGESVGQLEKFYATLFRPGVSTTTVARTAPPWPRGTPRAGRRPDQSTLARIRVRFNTEAAVNSLVPITRFLNEARKKAALLPVGQGEETLDAIITFIGQELIAAKMQGVDLVKNLDAVRGLQFERRTRLQERAVAARERVARILAEKYETEKAEQKARAKKAKYSPAREKAIVQEMFGVER